MTCSFLRKEKHEIEGADMEVGIGAIISCLMHVSTHEIAVQRPIFKVLMQVCSSHLEATWRPCGEQLSQPYMARLQIGGSPGLLSFLHVPELAATALYDTSRYGWLRNSSKLRESLRLISS
jgi:hypothetical protein